MLTKAGFSTILLSIRRRKYEGGKVLVMIEPPNEKVLFFKATLGLLLYSQYLKVITLENILV